MDRDASNYCRFLQGDKDGMTEIIKAHMNGLILYINSITNDIYLAEDLVEDTFVKLFVRKPHFRGKSSFKTWLYTIARNVALDRLRDEKNKSLDINDRIRDIARDHDDLESSYIRSESKIIVHKALSKLNTEYRQVLYLTFFEGLDNAETAKIMKKSKRQIENLAYRAKISLKKQLIDEGFCYEDL